MQENVRKDVYVYAESLRIRIQMLTNLKTPMPLMAPSQVPTPKTCPSRTVSKHQLSAAADHRPVMQPCQVIGILLGAVVSQLPQVGYEVATLVFHPFFCVIEVGVIITL
jgi:hypothetical protein